MNYNFNKVILSLATSEKRVEKETEKLSELDILFNQAMAFTNTSQVDFSVFTPEKILEIADYAILNASVISERVGNCHSFMQEVSQKPKVPRRKRFGAAY